MAYEWRRVCGETACGPSTGSPARPAARRRMVQAPCRDSGAAAGVDGTPPGCPGRRRPGPAGPGPGRPQRRRRRTRRSAPAGSGRPCRAAATVPSSRSRSSTAAPTASEMRAPVPYRNSSSARSRSASGAPSPVAATGPAVSSSRITSSTGSARGSRRGGGGRADVPARVGAGQPLAQREAVQAAHRAGRAGGRGRRPAAGGRRRRRAAAPGAPRPAPVPTDGEVGDAGGGQGGQVPVQVPAVRGERVRRQPPLDGQVVEVAAHGTAQGRRGLLRPAPARRPVRRPVSASYRSGQHVGQRERAMPCASATGP